MTVAPPKVVVARMVEVPFATAVATPVIESMLTNAAPVGTDQRTGAAVIGAPAPLNTVALNVTCCPKEVRVDGAAGATVTAVAAFDTLTWSSARWSVSPLLMTSTFAEPGPTAKIQPDPSILARATLTSELRQVTVAVLAVSAARRAFFRTVTIKTESPMLPSVGADEVIWTVAGKSVTMTALVSALPLFVIATTEVWPTESAITRPSVSTRATLVLSDVQVSVVSVTVVSTVPSALRAVAVASAVSPRLVSRIVAGVSSSVFGLLVTTIVIESFTRLADAMIWVLPVSLAVMVTGVELFVCALAELVEDQLTVPFCQSWPSESLTDTLRVWEPPIDAMVSVRSPMMVMDLATCATVKGSGLLSLTPLWITNAESVPFFCAVTTPVSG